MAFCCQLLLLPRTAASRYCCRHCCHCLSRGSSGGAGMAACGGGSGSSSSGSSGGGSGAILFLVVVVILLLFRCSSRCCHRCRCCRRPLPSLSSLYPIAPSPVAPSPSTFASRCPIHHLCRSRCWLVVAFSARPAAAYQLNHQADNVFMFPHLDFFFTYLE